MERAERLLQLGVSERQVSRRVLRGCLKRDHLALFKQLEEACQEPSLAAELPLLVAALLPHLLEGDKTRRHLVLRAILLLPPSSIKDRILKHMATLLKPRQTGQNRRWTSPLHVLCARAYAGASVPNMHRHVLMTCVSLDDLHAQLRERHTELNEFRSRIRNVADWDALWKEHGDNGTLSLSCKMANLDDESAKKLHAISNIARRIRAKTNSLIRFREEDATRHVVLSSEYRNAVALCLRPHLGQQALHSFFATHLLQLPQYAQLETEYMQRAAVLAKSTQKRRRLSRLCALCTNSQSNRYRSTVPSTHPVLFNALRSAGVEVSHLVVCNRCDLALRRRKSVGVTPDLLERVVSQHGGSYLEFCAPSSTFLQAERQRARLAVLYLLEFRLGVSQPTLVECEYDTVDQLTCLRAARYLCRFLLRANQSCPLALMLCLRLFEVESDAPEHAECAGRLFAHLAVQFLYSAQTRALPTVVAFFVSQVRSRNLISQIVRTRLEQVLQAIEAESTIECESENQRILDFCSSLSGVVDQVDQDALFESVSALSLCITARIKRSRTVHEKEVPYSSHQVALSHADRVEILRTTLRQQLQDAKQDRHAMSSLLRSFFLRTLVLAVVTGNTMELTLVCQEVRLFAPAAVAAFQTGVQQMLLPDMTMRRWQREAGMPLCAQRVQQKQHEDPFGFEHWSVLWQPPSMQSLKQGSLNDLSDEEPPMEEGSDDENDESDQSDFDGFGDFADDGLLSLSSMNTNNSAGASVSSEESKSSEDTPVSTDSADAALMGTQFDNLFQ
ncbi:MAG: hypothetical protein MHM6MM_002443 [Cercozoa sp. M6MM]